MEFFLLQKANFKAQTHQTSENNCHNDDLIRTFPYVVNGGQNLVL